MAGETNGVIRCPMCKSTIRTSLVTGSRGCFNRGCPLGGVEFTREQWNGLSYHPPSDAPTRAIRIAVGYFDEPGDELAAISAGGPNGDGVAMDCLRDSYPDEHPRIAFVTANLPIGKPVEVEGTVDA